MKCARCGRYLKVATATGYGPRCEMAVLGRVSKRRRGPGREPDPRQLVLLEAVA